MVSERITLIGRIGKPVTWKREASVQFPLITDEGTETVSISGFLAKNPGDSYEGNRIKVYGYKSNTGILNTTEIVLKPLEPEEFEL
jgi:hypothetical protein